MDADAPAFLTTDALAPPLARLLGGTIGDIPAWSCRRLAGGAGTALGVWRVTGTACHADGEREWALVLKGWAPPGTTGDPIREAEAARERALYRSGCLATLPGGIRAPISHGEVDAADGSTWIWFEQVTDHAAVPWSRDRYVAVSRVLGRFNGAYLMGLPSPDVPELSRDWLRGWLAPVDAAMRRLAEVREVPLVREVYPPAAIDLFARIWADREAHLAALDRLPKGFCHLDAFRRNLLIGRAPDGAEEVIAIDWEFAGEAAIGEELVPLVIGSAIFHEVSPADLPAVEAAAVASYVDGLREAGWDGDASLVWTGYRTAAVLRYGLGAVPIMLPYLLAEGGIPALEAFFGYPWREIRPNLLALGEHFTVLARELT